MDKYSLLTDAYFGTGLFENGAGLRQHPREDPANYKDRQGLAYYLNYTGPIVNAAVDPIFKTISSAIITVQHCFRHFLMTVTELERIIRIL